MHIFFQQKGKKIFIGSIVLILALSFGMDIFLFQTQASQMAEGGRSAAIGTSPFADPTPRIDDEAAAIACEEGGEVCSGEEVSLPCRSLPAGIWIFLLAAYIFLLVFNLSADFGQAQKVRWFWEALFTLLAILAWYAYDGCQAFVWYPLYVLKFGLIIYLFYFYLLSEKIKEEAKS